MRILTVLTLTACQFHGIPLLGHGDGQHGAAERSEQAEQQANLPNVTTVYKTM